MTLGFFSERAAANNLLRERATQQIVDRQLLLGVLFLELGVPVARRGDRQLVRPYREFLRLDRQQAVRHDTRVRRESLCQLREQRWARRQIIRDELITA